MKTVIFLSAFALLSAQSSANPILRLVENGELPLRPPPVQNANGFQKEIENDEAVVAFFLTLSKVTEIIQGRVSPAAGTRSTNPWPPISKDRGRFQFTFEPVVLKGAELLSIGPMGTLLKGKWTGAEQFYRLGDGSHVRIQEDHLAVTGGKLFLNRAAVNANVAGAPASLLVFRDKQGRRLEEVLWTDNGRMISLTFAPAVPNSASIHGYSAEQLARTLTGH